MAAKWDAIAVEDQALAAYVALPDTPGPHPGVVVIQHAAGVDEVIKDAVRRLADAGFAAIAPDMFAHQDVNVATPHLDRQGRMQDSIVIKDVGGAVAHLRQRTGDQGIGIVGFCLGGRVAYLMAAVPAVLACFVMAVIGSAIPASGSLYLIIRDVLSPMLGFLYLWLMVSMADVVTPLIALGFADYFSHFYSGLNSRFVALTVIALIIVINYLGMEVASGFQNLMVIGFILALLIFGIGGLTHADPALMKPLFPRGWSPIVVAATTAYFSYAGVFIIAEVAG